jgi:hypothetical protein
VNALEPPAEGEQWVGDADLPGFGVRLWAGKKGGGACYAVRVRDHRGRIVRESFSIWSDWHARYRIRRLLEQDEIDLPLGSFLDDAREWARDRIRILKGGKSRSERRHELYCRASKAAQQLSLAQVADRTFQKLERSGRNADYASGTAREMLGQARPLYGLPIRFDRDYLDRRIREESVGDYGIEDLEA